MPRALGLDLGRKMGFANASPEYLRGWRPRTALEGPRASNAGLEYGEWSLGPGDHDGLYRGLWQRLEASHAAAPLSMVFYESSGGHYQSMDAIWIQVGLAVVIRLWCKLNEVDSELINNSTVKRHAALHGKADKGDMIRAAERLGWTPSSDHVADALFVLDAKLTEHYRLRR